MNEALELNSFMYRVTSVNQADKALQVLSIPSSLHIIDKRKLAIFHLFFVRSMSLCHPIQGSGAIILNQLVGGAAGYRPGGVVQYLEQRHDPAAHRHQTKEGEQQLIESGIGACYSWTERLKG